MEGIPRPDESGLLLTLKWCVRPWIGFCWLLTTLQKLISCCIITHEPGLAPVPGSKLTHVTALIIRGASYGSWPRNEIKRYLK